MTRKRTSKIKKRASHVQPTKSRQEPNWFKVVIVTAAVNVVAQVVTNHFDDWMRAFFHVVSQLLAALHGFIHINTPPNLRDRKIPHSRVAWAYMDESMLAFLAQKRARTPIDALKKAPGSSRGLFFY